MCVCVELTHGWAQIIERPLLQTKARTHRQAGSPCKVDFWFVQPGGGAIKGNNAKNVQLARGGVERGYWSSSCKRPLIYTSYTQAGVDALPPLYTACSCPKNNKAARNSRDNSHQKFYQFRPYTPRLFWVRENFQLNLSTRKISTVVICQFVSGLLTFIFVIWIDLINFIGAWQQNWVRKLS